MKRLLLCTLMASNLNSLVYAQNKPDDFIDVATLTSNIEVELRYLGNNNFVGKQVDGYKANKCFCKIRQLKH